MNWLDEILKIAAAKTLVVSYVEEEEAQRRFSICQGCTHFNAKHIQCNVCGCYLEVKTKCKVNRAAARPNGELTHCPMGYWGDIEIANFYRAEDGKDLLI